jgi:hypothetical protein
MAKIFNTDIRKMAVLLLPTMLRGNVMVAFLQSMVLPFQSILSKGDAVNGVPERSDVLSFRTDSAYRLAHTGQVVYLRKVLNDAYPGRSVDFVIEDATSDYKWVYVYTEEDPAFIPLQQWIGNDAAPTVLYDENYIQGANNYFSVGVPTEIFADENQMNRVRRLASDYKLVSKNPIYKSL